MKNMTKGQKFFLLLIISVICVFAFCMAGCHTSCFDCEVGHTTKQGNQAIGILNTCDSYGKSNSCGIGSGCYTDDQSTGFGVRFLADSIGDIKVDKYGNFVRYLDTTAVYGNASFYSDSDDRFNFNAYVGTYSDQDDDKGKMTGFRYEEGEFDFFSCQPYGIDAYYFIKYCIDNIFS